VNIDVEESYAMSGAQIWRNIESKYRLGKFDIVICFPTTNVCLNEMAMKHIEKYATGKYLKRVIIVLNEESISDTNTTTDIVIEKELLSKSKMRSFIYFIRLVNICDRIIVISAEEPFGNLNLLGKYDIDLDDYVSGTYI